MSESCPICHEPTVHDYRPFCSPRCKLVDLQKWFSGAYAVAAENQSADEREVSFQTED